MDSRSEVKDVYEKSRNIKIPQKERHTEFVFDGISGVFAQLQLVPVNQPEHVGTSKTRRLNRIDMELVRLARGYDKKGYKLLIPTLKEILFGNRKAPITKKRAEEFFDNPGNFV